MLGKNSKRSRGSYAREFAAVWAVLAMALALSARPAAAAPFAYVTNSSSGNVSVIDTATNMVVTTVTVPFGANGVAVTPDGRHAYVADDNFVGQGTVSVIAAASNTVAATIPVGRFPNGVAVTPDGAHAYVTNLGTSPFFLGTVSVIDTATNTVVDTINVGTRPVGVAITPDGQHAYVASNNSAGTISVLATASNTLVGSPITV